MNLQTGKAHLRLLGFKPDSTWGATHMKHPDTAVIVYYEHQDQTWDESNISFGPTPTEILRVLNRE